MNENTDDGNSRRIMSLNIERQTEVLQSYVRADAENITDKIKDEFSKKSSSKRIKDKLRKDRNIPDSPTDIINKPTTFDQLVKEMKLKNKSQFDAIKLKRNEEIYTDKDRAAAVNLGSKDIIQSLKMKRKQERSKALEIPEETEPGTLLALGRHEMRAGNFKLSLNSMNKALELNSKDKNALVARSQCYLLIGNPKNALEDAEAALKIDKNFIKALFQKAEALYHLGDFEYSLMYFHQGLKIRPEMEEFRLGVQKAQEAIENVIGNDKVVFPTSPTVLKKLFKDIGLVDNLPDPNTMDNKKVSKNIFTKKSTNRVKGSKSLESIGNLHTDKKYLENLLKNQDLIKLKKNFSNTEILKHAEEGIQYLETRQEFWRQQQLNESKD